MTDRKTRDPKHDARFYIDQVGMSARPEYYSGCGPSTSDLGHRHLTKFHELVTKHGGEKAAEAFVAMVASLKSGAATTFLNGLYALERMDWKWKDVDPSSAGIDRGWDLGDSRGEERDALAAMTVMAALGTGGDNGYASRDYAVRGAFLESHRYTQGENGHWRKLRKDERPKQRMSKFEYGS